MSTATSQSLPLALNAERNLYVIESSGGYSCFGFENARDHARQMLDLALQCEPRATADHRAALLAHPAYFLDQDYGTEIGYEKYLKCCQIFASSKASTKTYFDPKTPQKVRQVLESCIRSGNPVRIVLGDPETGRVWLEENDVEGRIGRSMGPQRVPLLIAPGEHGGGSILTSCVLRIIDLSTWRDLYKASNYVEPSLEIVTFKKKGYAFSVMRDGELQASFKNIDRTAAYIAFHRCAPGVSAIALHRAH